MARKSELAKLFETPIPKDLIIPDIQWKFLLRSVFRGKNVLMVGPSGCGKTLAARTISKLFNDREFFYFNLGSTQDPRSTLIGNTHFRKESGTYFAASVFVRAIQTPNAIILLDEVSRAHPEAANILMTVLDEGQRYLRLDEQDDAPTIKVAPGVTFIGTANIGVEYTAARVMDRALLDRFIRIEMLPPTSEEELKLINSLYSNADKKSLEALTQIAKYTREQIVSENPSISTIISTRMVVEAGGLAEDGFSLAEIAEVAIYPFYSPQGGAESERVKIRQVVQKYLPTDFDKKDKPWGKEEEDDYSDAEMNKMPFSPEVLDKLKAQAIANSKANQNTATKKGP